MLFMDSINHKYVGAYNNYKWGRKL